MSNVTELIEFIKKSSSPYHTVNTVKEALLGAGYTELSEKDAEGYSDGGRHFVIRGGTSLIAFKGKSSDGGFMIAASHSDFPSYKVKREVTSQYTRLTVEPYGGMMHYTWLDRPLSVAGRVLVRTDYGAKNLLVDLKRDVAVIPSVAIHMNRGVNDGYKFNPAVDLLPLVGGGDAASVFSSEVAKAAGVTSDEIVSEDLFLYNRDEGRVFGINGEYILSPRLDDLGCVFASMKAFLESDEGKCVSVLAIFDNEEVGSSTKQGANSTFLEMTLRRIASSDERFYSMLADSFMVSADNAHAKHPNHPELSDANEAPLLGCGVVIKYNANQRYTTDAVSDAIFRTLAERAGAKVQCYANRADIPGGSTLGSIANTRVSVPTVDVGLPQLAMHSANETAAVSDLADMIAILKETFSSGVKIDSGEIRMV